MVTDRQYRINARPGPVAWTERPRALRDHRDHPGRAISGEFCLWRLARILRSGYLGVMTEVTRVLNAIGQGEPGAPEQLLPLVYDELRRLAAQKMTREAPGQTLQAT